MPSLLGESADDSADEPTHGLVDQSAGKSNRGSSNVPGAGEGRSQLFAFVLVGSIGFVVDAGLLTFLSKAFGMNLYLARLFSFSCATLVTWLINRVFTFRSITAGTEAHYSEYMRYVFVQVIAALVNLAVFALLIAQYPFMAEYPVLPLAVGAVFGMVINFVGARHWVYPAREG